MKKIQGFGYVEKIEHEDEEKENTNEEWAQGFIETFAHPELEVKDYSCPRCGRFLFSADINLHGVIFMKCRKCKREIFVETKPIAQRIGFV